MSPELYNQIMESVGAGGRRQLLGQAIEEGREVFEIVEDALTKAAQEKLDRAALTIELSY